MIFKDLLDVINDDEWVNLYSSMGVALARDYADSESIRSYGKCEVSTISGTDNEAIAVMIKFR